MTKNFSSDSAWTRKWDYYNYSRSHLLESWQKALFSGILAKGIQWDFLKSTKSDSLNLQIFPCHFSAWRALLIGFKNRTIILSISILCTTLCPSSLNGTLLKACCLFQPVSVKRRAWNMWNIVLRPLSQDRTQRIQTDGSQEACMSYPVGGTKTTR